VPALIWLNRQYGLEASVLEFIGSRRKNTPPAEPPSYSRRTVFVFVDDFDLATIAALRYARSLRPTTMHAVHFVIDNVQADRLRQDWVRANTGIVLDFVDCPDRRLASAAAAMVNAEASLPGVGVTAILPRRSYAPLLGRLLHDRTADKMAGVISRIPHAAATIVPFDVRSRVEALAARQAAVADGRDGGPQAAGGPAAPDAPTAGSGQGPGSAGKTGWRAAGQAAAAQPGHGQPGPGPGTGQPGGGPAGDTPASGGPASGGPAATGPAGQGEDDPAPGQAAPARGQDAPAEDPSAPVRESERAEAAQPGEAAMLASDGSDYDRPVPPAGVAPIGSLVQPGRAVVEGRVHTVEIRPVEHNTVLACDIADSTGELTALFYGRSNIPGLRPGSKVRLRGPVGMREGMPVMVNPAYELLAQSTGRPPKSRPRRAPRPDRRRDDGDT
jgi:hypothetical protein